MMRSVSMPDIRTYPGADSLARAAAQRFVGLALEAVADQGQFGVALSGGSTARAAHTLLASEDLGGRVVRSIRQNCGLT